MCVSSRQVRANSGLVPSNENVTEVLLCAKDKIISQTTTEFTSSSSSVNIPNDFKHTSTNGFDNKELLAFPNESTHTYSYNPLSPNSLTVRLSILKRSLEIIIRSPEMLREPTSSSIPSNNIHNSSNENNNNTTPSIFYHNNSASHSNEIINTQKSNLENLLAFLNETLENNTSERASDLHMISLLNINKLFFNTPDENEGNDSETSKTMHLKRTLLTSLADPFFDNIKELPSSTSEANLEFNLSQEYNKVLHNFNSGKNSAPQAIFTCDSCHPWNFKGANDLACLTFGLSKSALKVLTLLDLIHPDSRNFVLQKLLAMESSNDKSLDMVFTGETVPIAQTGGNSKELIWASIWAKRKNNLLVFVFEKVPCDYADLMLS